MRTQTAIDPKRYLFTGYVNDKNEIVGKVKPLVNTLFYAAKPDEAVFEEGRPILLRSDGNAILQGFNENTLGDINGALSDANKVFSSRLYSRDLKPEEMTDPPPIPVVIPPVEALSYIATTSVKGGGNWAKKFIEVMKDFNVGPECAKLVYVDVKIENVAEPDDNDEGYKAWYKNNKGQNSFPGYILPKIRGIFLVYSLPEFGEKVDKVLVHVPGREKPEIIRGNLFELSENTDFYIHVLTGTEKQYPKGMYEFTVVFYEKPGGAQEWSDSIIGLDADGEEPDEYSFTLSAMCRFDYEIPGGEFSMINGDPISLEESLLAQFPSQYAHLILQAQEYRNKTIEPGKRSPEQTTLYGKNRLIRNLGLAKSWSDLTNSVGLAKSTNGAAWLLGKALQDKISTYEDKNLASVLNCTFAARNVYTSLNASNGEFWLSIIDAIDDYDDWADGGLTFAHFTANTLGDNARNFITNFEVENFNQTRAFRLGVPEIAAAAFGKALVVIDTGLMLKSVYDGGRGLYLKDVERDKAKQVFKDILDDYLVVTNFKAMEKVIIEVQFAHNSAEIIAGDENLQAFVLKMQASPGQKLKIAGHTCWLGSEKYNLDLSKRRAEAVKVKLVELGCVSACIETVGEGESSPIGDNDREKGRIKNRRVVAEFEAPVSKGAPCREGMGNCERLRVKTINATLAKYDAVVKLGESLVDLAIGIASWIPITAPFAMAIGLAKAGASLVSEASHLVTTNIASQCDIDILDAATTAEAKMRRGLSHSSIANQLLMRDLCINYAGTGRVPKESIPEVQHRIRSEALYGLLNLLVRAAVSAGSWEFIDSGEDFNTKLGKKLEKYRVGEYIENFILKDGWIFPLKTFTSISMDQMWLYTVNSHNRVEFVGNAIDKALGAITGNVKSDASDGKAPATLSDGVGVSETYDATKEFVTSGGPVMFYANLLREDNQAREVLMAISQMMQTNNPFLPSDVSANFHKIFPIHHFSSMDSKNPTESIKDFANHFHVSWKHIRQLDNCYHYTAVYCRNESSSGWELLVNTEGKFLNMRTLSPYSQLKVVVILHEDITCLVPLDLQLIRTDDYDTYGPRYKSWAKPLRREELEGLPGIDAKSMDGFYGHVFEPFYRFGSMSIPGVKPLMNQFWKVGTALTLGSNDANAQQNNGATVENYASAGHLKNMEYAFKTFVAKSSNGDWMPLCGTLTGNKWDADNVVSDFPVTLDDAKDEQSIFLIEDFLRSNAITDTVDTMFKPENVSLTVLIRINGQSWITPRASFDVDIKNSNCTREKDTLIIDNFNWKTKVEFAFVFSGIRRDIDAYVKKKRPYNRFKGSIKLCEDRPWHDINLDNDLHGPVLGGLTFEQYDPNDENKPLYYDELKDVYRIIDAAPKSKSFVTSKDNAKSNDNVVKSKDDVAKSKDILRADQVIRHHASTDGGITESALAIYSGLDVHTYVAYKEMTHEGIHGVKVESIRPFGNGKIDDNGKPEDDYYCYKFVDPFASVGMAEGVANSPEFHFSSPKDFFDEKEVPWWKKKVKSKPLRKPKVNKKVKTKYDLAIDWLEKNPGQLNKVVNKGVVEGFNPDDYET